MRWLNEVIDLFSHLKTSSRTAEKTRQRFESLENRSMLAADLSILNFGSDGTNLVVSYESANQAAAGFDIAIYRSFDGMSLDQLLVTQRIDVTNGIGAQQAFIPANFGDLEQDYQLLVVIDANSEIAETDEQNNQATFAGGAFLDTDNVIQVHGTMASDYIVLAQEELLHISLNEISYAYLNTEVTSIHLRTHDGDDILFASYDFNPTIVAFGGEGSNIFFGGAGNDRLYGGTGADYMFGGAGNDSLFGEDGDDYLGGEDGDDLLEGGTGSNTLSGGAGADTLGPSDETSSYYGYGDILDAGEGDDTIYGTPGDDIIDGGAGNDTIYGLGGNDQLFGGDGDDIFYGGDGEDYLYGGNGSDTLYGGAGNDSLFGDDGDDYLCGESGDDYLVGGCGVDTFNSGGETGDTIGDLPVISNFAFNYIAANDCVEVAGTIIDDDSCANLYVNYSGVTEGSIAVDESGAFSTTICLPVAASGWMYFTFTDTEGLAAERIEMSLS